MKNHVALVYILDRSASMTNRVDECRSTFNESINMHRAEGGDFTVTTVLFADDYQLLHDAKPIEEVEELNSSNYRLGGCTALIFAVGKTLKDVNDRIASMSKSQKPSQVICTIMTDGEENASEGKGWTNKAVAELKKELEDGDTDWVFTFIGPEETAWAQAGSIGFTLSETAAAPLHTPGMMGQAMRFSHHKSLMARTRGSAVAKSISYSAGSDYAFGDKGDDDESQDSGGTALQS